jgi:hypothetical protein
MIQDKLFQKYLYILFLGKKISLIKRGDILLTCASELIIPNKCLNAI